MKFLSFLWSESLWRHRLCRLDAKTLAERRIHSADLHHVPARSMDRKMILKRSQVTAGHGMVHLTELLCRREGWLSRDWRFPGAGEPPDWRRPREDWQLWPQHRAVGTPGWDISSSSSQVSHNSPHENNCFKLITNIVIKLLKISDKSERVLAPSLTSHDWVISWHGMTANPAQII